MALILNIDTSTEICSVAIARDGKLLALKENDEGLNHSVLLGVYVDELLKENGIRAKELDAVAVSMGPGSYTGLRIGVSLAKGICFGTGKPLIAISTLKALAISVARNVDEEALFCPMIDARRMEVYSAIFNRNGEMIRDVRAEIIDPSSFSDWLVDHKIYFFGNGSGKVKEVIVHPHARFVDRVVTSAVNMITLAEQKWEEKTFEDLAYFEPFYLKDFIATVPKKKVL
ncbi:tRNA (adenosine(37)-N6)-threonylcarbamoyltransferase complex dimerization subunit type 1 TsaB [Sanguibacteroides justesenii]|uniref:Glycoprotease n=1 Tax=Sanguibacteroides justesenii TaxID=1547597 RepID=A0A0C3MDQ9_9PORP|nr:tRNA (adenosine(37)-N6)-threonylcarbamoyltransferase complex dimerization subunit type 1 TsaB [Sanguibacteroides justesenii]KIO44558.1 glycoprotease [Sanguibacteroides justesenii]KIO45189.1 glycoprotease [Sanguibacteroides justesenii]PXZ44479.1 tRNA (adenosine(37)-N6)-threonylcarbamoyltransferase complex dimerization subunit type 1 TsaB [Sanguibacteroides justesenii]